MAVIPLAPIGAAAAGGTAAAAAARAAGTRAAGSIGSRKSVLDMVGDAIGGLLGGRDSRPETRQEIPTQIDSSPQEERMRQLSVVGDQPSAISSTEMNNNRSGGFADPAVLQLLRSIDANIRSLRDGMNQSSVASQRLRATSRAALTNPNVGSFGIGLLGVGIGALLGDRKPAASNPQINEPANSSEQQLERTLNVPSAPQVEMGQTLDNDTRQGFDEDLNNLRNSLNDIRNRANQFSQENRNPNQNTTIARIISSAEGRLQDLSSLYNADTLDSENIREVRRSILANLASVMNMIQGNRPQPQQQQREIQDVTPDDSQNVDLSEATTNSNYLLDGMQSNASILDIVSSNSNFDTNLLMDNYDNVNRKLSSIESTRNMGGNPVIINAGQQQPAIVPVPTGGQQNTPVSQPGTGAIQLSYKSHPMMASEPRSPAFSSHP